ncbi:hypothetical protein, partial [Escherichia coli]|uniref:hypothetical protein n=1 Tax=Escherichia coli TaxID=562 RepID=UPI001A9174E5
LKTSIKTITYLSDTGCLEIQGASLVTFPVTLSVVTGKSGFCIAPENTQTVMLPQRQQAF